MPPPPLIPPPDNILTGLSVAIAAAASWIPPPPPFPSLAPPAHASSFKSASNALLLHPLRHHMVISLCCFSFFCCSPSSSSSSFSSPRAYLPTNTAPQPKTPPFRHQTKQTNPKKKKLPTLMHQTTSTATTQSPYDLHNPQKIPKTGQKHKRTPQQKAAAAATILWRWRGSQKGDRRARCLLACWLATEWIFQVNQDRSIVNSSVPIRSNSLLACLLAAWLPSYRMYFPCKLRPFDLQFIGPDSLTLSA